MKRAKSAGKASGKRKAKQSQAPDPPKLEPDHPNYDTIMLRRARLETYRKRRRKNRPDLSVK